MLTSYKTLLYKILPSLLLSFASVAEPAKVVISIKPLHSIVMHITEGIEPVKVLLSGQQSAHHFQLKPSQRRMLNQADLFIYANDSIESFVPALKGTLDHLTFIELSKIPGIKTLPARHSHTHVDEHDDYHEKTSIDGHLWLSISNTIIVSRYISQVLSQRNPQHTQAYQQNQQVLEKKLEQLRQQNQLLLKNLGNKPFLVFHNAFQYFETENQLQHASFISNTPQSTPGIKRIRELKKEIKKNNTRCIFYEPPNIPPLINTLTEGTQVKLAPLDPAGTQIPQGKQHYFELMRQTAETISQCLKNRE